MRSASVCCGVGPRRRYLCRLVSFRHHPAESSTPSSAAAGATGYFYWLYQLLGVAFVGWRGRGTPLVIVPARGADDDADDQHLFLRPQDPDRHPYVGDVRRTVLI